MKRLYVEKKEEVLTTSEPTPFCGFIDKSNEKGYLVTGSDNLIHPIAFGDSTWGALNNGWSGVSFPSMGRAIRWMEGFSIYFFDSRIELHEWLISDEDT
jgi:hypothetical protein